MDILKKSVALGYFLEYLGDLQKKNLLDFWLEAETLRMVSETNYCRRTPINSRRRISRTRSLNATPVKANSPLQRQKSQSISNSGLNLTTISSLNKEGDVCDNETCITPKTIDSTSMNAKEMLARSNSVVLPSECVTPKNTFDPPLNRSASILRSYEDFKSRAKSRSKIVNLSEGTLRTLILYYWNTKFRSLPLEFYYSIHPL